MSSGEVPRLIRQITNFQDHLLFEEVQEIILT